VAEEGARVSVPPEKEGQSRYLRSRAAGRLQQAGTVTRLGHKGLRLGWEGWAERSGGGRKKAEGVTHS